MKILQFFMLSLSFALAALPSASAEEAQMNAQLLRELPSEKTIFVQVLDNSDQNLALKADIENELQKNGYSLSESAPLVLNFTTQDQLGVWDSGSKRYIFSFEAKSGTEGHEDTRKARVNVFDSATGGLLNKSGNAQGTTSTASQYRLDITVESRTTGKTFWRGWSEAALEAGDSQALIKKMIPPLMKIIGQTVRKQSFTIH